MGFWLQFADPAAGGTEELSREASSGKHLSFEQPLSGGANDGHAT